MFKEMSKGKLLQTWAWADNYFTNKTLTARNAPDAIHLNSIFSSTFNIAFVLIVGENEYDSLSNILLYAIISLLACPEKPNQQWPFVNFSNSEY